MYYEHFGLSGAPFEFNPSASVLFMSAGHREGLAALEWGLSEPSGFTMLVGEIGAGKTTLIYSLLSTRRAGVKIAWVANPRLSFEDMMRQMLGQLGAEQPQNAGKLELLRAFDAQLASLGADECVAVIVDEAQDLSDDALEDLRLLSNFQSLERRRLQIVLVGQIELARRLSAPSLRQLNQRIGARALLPTLKGKEISDYVEYRLRSRGGSIERMFTPGAVKELARASGGIPRCINVLCHNALLLAYAGNAQCADVEHVRDAARDYDHLLDGGMSRRTKLVAKTAAGANAAIYSAGSAMRQGAFRLGHIARASSPGRSQAGAVAATLMRAAAGALAATALLGAAAMLFFALHPMRDKPAMLAAQISSRAAQLRSYVEVGLTPVQFKSAPEPRAVAYVPRTVEVSPIVVHDGPVRDGSAGSTSELNKLNRMIPPAPAGISEQASAPDSSRPHAMPIQIKPVPLAPTNGWAAAEDVLASPVEASTHAPAAKEAPAKAAPAKKLSVAAPDPATVQVQPGDTLSSIANKLYGATGSDQLGRLAAANPQIKDANVIYPGQSIRVNQTGRVNQASGMKQTSNTNNDAERGVQP